MDKYYSQFESRKQDHIKLALMQENQAYESAVFDNYYIMHEALPEFNFEDLSLETLRLNKKVKNPFIIASMTAGHKDALILNTRLLEACEEQSWAMGVGSQRRELSDHSASEVWLNLRKQFPKLELYSNLGLAQLIENNINTLKRLSDSLEANAFIIHCNPLQEALQKEGTPNFKGGLKAIESLVRSIELPVIIKETGCGFSKNTIQALNDCGVSAIELSGLGGTHWGRIEGCRSDGILKKAAQVFKNWGIDTIQSMKFANECKLQAEIWGSGGVRNGLDAAKLLALGANSISIAKPMLEVALIDTNSIINLMQAFELELSIAMFCSGSKKIEDLKGKLCQR